MGAMPFSYKALHFSYMVNSRTTLSKVARFTLLLAELFSYGSTNLFRISVVPLTLERIKCTTLILDG